MRQQIAHAAFLLNLGPQSWPNIVIGFNENLNRPFGLGRYGCWLGSYLPFPAGVRLASSSVKICREIWILP